MEQQNQSVQIEEGVSLMDIIRLLLSKIKLLILVVIISAVFGASITVWRTININYFGTKVEFYVNPEKPEDSSGTLGGPAAGGSQYGVYGAYGRHVMDNMVKLLSSDSFAEKLLLDGEELPTMEIEWFGATEKDQDGVLKNEKLSQAIAEAQPYLDSVALMKTAYENALSAKANAIAEYDKADVALDNEWRLLFQQGLVKKASFNEEEYFALVSRPAALTTAYQAFVAAQNNVTRKNLDANNAEEAWKTAQNTAKVPIEKALDIWRGSNTYVSLLSFYKNSISYDYLESDADYEDANNLARSFIYVTISVQNSSVDEGMRIGNRLLERVKKVVPQYISENMTVPDGYSGTNCQRITRTDDIHLTNPLYTTKQAIKYGIFMALFAFVGACVVIIILDRSDKRLRDTEIITKKFNVPLLGVVPTIEELTTEQPAKKNNKTSEVE